MRRESKLSWLDEDYVASTDIRSQMKKASRATYGNVPERPKPTSRATKSQLSSRKIHLSLDVNLDWLRISLLLAWFRRFFSRKLVIVPCILLLVFSIGLYKIVLSKKPSSDTSKVLSGTVTEPEFDILLPDDSKDGIENFKVAYDAGKRVASFRDYIGATGITVSQQELPKTLQENTDTKVQELAESFSAITLINESNPKAYLGTSAKGPQTVIFHKQGLLVFVQSTRTIDKSLWAEYITRLR